ncbi:MAG: TIGR01906 family membrane protein [Bacillota bacterium]
MRLLKWIIWITFPIFIIALAASLLTTKPYMQISKGLYASHDAIEYDHDYVAGQLMEYLNYRRDDLLFGADEGSEDPIMRDIEIRHMEDVKDVYTYVRIAGIVSFILFLFSAIYLYKRSFRTLYDAFRNTYILPSFFILFVGGWFIIDFSLVFTIFHQIFFTNDDWILRSDDVLIQLLPQNFWLISGALILIFLAVSLGLLQWFNRAFLKPKMIKEGYNGSHQETRSGTL